MGKEEEIREALNDFLESRVFKFLKGCAKAARFNYFMVLLLNFFAFAPLAATSTIAAIDEGEAWARITMITLPLVSAISSGLLLKLNLVTLWKGRQKARINLRNLYDDTKRQMILAEGAEELAAIYTQVIVEYQVIEQSLSRNLSRAMKPVFTQPGSVEEHNTETINFKPTAYMTPKNTGDGNS